MQQQVKNYLTPITEPIDSLNKYLSDRILLTDLASKLMISFGVVLIVGGLYLMILNPGGASSPLQAYTATQSVVSAINWVPGIPFYISINSFSTSITGLVAWLIGLDVLLVGLGIWVRHPFARFIALAVFGLSACFQLAQLVYYGILGSPSSIFTLAVDVVLLLFIISRFDGKRPAKSPKVN